jgi:hypothetical protein
VSVATGGVALVLISSVLISSKMSYRELADLQPKCVGRRRDLWTVIS